MTAYLDREALKAQIRSAFAMVEYPGDWCLRRCNEGEEPLLLEQEFRGKSDWQSLDPKFLDQAPGGNASALSFFSDEAFRFYLPAYLIADIDGRLEHVDPTFQLCHGLDDAMRDQHVNPRRYGDRTWFEEACYKLAIFTRPQVSAIVRYLQFRHNDEESASVRTQIEQALINYWLVRMGKEKEEKKEERQE